jgi:hypothetical protein
MLSEFVQRQGDKVAGCRELSKPLLSLPKCRCTGLGHQPQVVFVSLARPAQLPKQRDGWGTGLRFLCWACPGAEALGWGTNLRVSVRSLAAVSIHNELGNSNKAVLTELPRGQVCFPKGDSLDALDAIDSMESLDPLDSLDWIIL